MRRTELQAQRRAVGLSQEALAQRVGVSVNSVRSWERGTQTPYLRHHEPLARHLGVSMPQLNRLLDPEAPPSLNGDTLNGSALAGIAEWLSMFVKAEQGSRSADVFEAVNMPALLQTRAYALALERTYHRPATDAEIERRVEMRLARAAVIDRRPDPLELTVRIPWYVLHQVKGDTDVMVAQLDHLAELAGRPNIDVRIVGAGPGVVAVPSSFTLLSTAGSLAPDLAAENGLTGVRYHENPTVVQEFAALFDRITEAALSPFDSRNLIIKTREDYR